eukprot:Blabericola_migrator_1__5505@NODE_2809_length_2329_cov_136_133952_g1759_i0_p1_GENE_NODE_2809_length_2329_cov_136_133952_g1759_i0NODE_2809_length_2329_cov_136_133952_g1759_i0_p1_ORF_typecomplete_len475_score40_98Acyltransferase/PF01553_21/2_1e15DUF2417/PF10329_9/42DUF2417/PF10329_9/0_042DUF1180/PF06679_12/0_54_NODE_2809_length_2329_cov_136_133952_g1759_i01971621
MIVRALALLWVVSCFVLFVLALRTFQLAKRKFAKEFNEQEIKQFKFLKRQDFNLTTQDYVELFIGAIVLFPIRAFLGLMTAASILLFLVIFSGTCTLDVTVNTYNQFLAPNDLPPRAKRDQDQQSRVRALLRKVVYYHCRFMIYVCGVTQVQEYKVLNHNFDFPIEESQKRIQVRECVEPIEVDADGPRCVVSNHVAMLDIVYYIMRLFPSFIAKSSVINHPVVGPCARALNCVFVNRSNVVDREKTIKIIGQRQEEIWKMSVHDFVNNGLSPKLKEFMRLSSSAGDLLQPTNCSPKELPSMVIFGEGTTSSGTTVMPLKRGAFLGLRPVTPCVLVYRCPQIHISYDIFTLCWLAPLIMSSFRSSKLDVYWLNEVLPPSPTAEDAETRSQLFARSVRAQMARVLMSQLSPGTDTPQYPEEWNGSMALKRECISRLFDSSSSTQGSSNDTPLNSLGRNLFPSSVVTTTQAAVSLT